MLKACSKCGRIHAPSFQCTPKNYKGGNERKLRSTYKWTKKSLQVRNDANYLCEYCRSKFGVIEYRNVEVHHITKINRGADQLLEDENLICLCQEHHKMADAGLIPQEELRDIANRRIEKHTIPGAKNNPPGVFYG